MRKLKFSPVFLLITLSFSFLNSCETDPADSNNNGNNVIHIEKISGYAQKGPYLIGTSISLSELNSGLSQTGKVFTASIGNNQGEFEINNIDLSSRYVEITANGFYFNELQGENSTAQLTLSAVSDISDRSTLNVNVLSHLEKDRLYKLVSEGSSYADAKKQAQEEVLKVFLIEKTDMDESETLNIAEDGDDNAILLAISVILQGHISVADMSELLGKLNTDLKEDGTLDDPAIGTSLINNARLADLNTIRTNLENRYEELGLDVTIPEFEKYVEYFIDSSGYNFDLFPVYQKFSRYGMNVLCLETDTFYKSDALSLAAELPAGTSLKVVLKGGLWYYQAAPNGPINWDIARYNEILQQQEFSAIAPGDSCDLILIFDVRGTSHKSFTIEYFENNSELPTRIRDIVVINAGRPGTEFLIPEDGTYGPNILAMEDSIQLETGIKYSLAVNFPESVETSIQYELMFGWPGSFSTDPTEIDLWTVDQDDTFLKISAQGKDIKPDMSIIFNQPDTFQIEGGGIRRVIKIK